MKKAAPNAGTPVAHASLTHRRPIIFTSAHIEGKKKYTQRTRDQARGFLATWQMAPSARQEGWRQKGTSSVADWSQHSCGATHVEARGVFRKNEFNTEQFRTESKCSGGTTGEHLRGEGDAHFCSACASIPRDSGEKKIRPEDHEHAQPHSADKSRVSENPHARDLQTSMTAIADKLPDLIAISRNTTRHATRRPTRIV